MKQFYYLIVFLVITGLSGCAPMQTGTRSQSAPKNIIVMVGDGMGVGQIEIARLMEKGKEGRLFLQSLPNVGLIQTYSYDNFVPDSGAAATSLATGIKTVNKRVGTTHDGKPVESIADLFKQNGKAVGLISTNTVTDATPAGYGSSAKSRSNQAEIARQLLANEYDILLGGGGKYFGAKKQKGPDLVPLFKGKGYSHVTNKSELAKAAGSERILGLFHKSYMNYNLDKEERNSNEPSLLEMTKAAIVSLSKNKNGFFLMSEGARIDHAAHAADATGIWKETIEFDKAVKYVVNWAKKNGNTLVVVVADHETMSIGAAEPMNIKALKAIEVSPEYMASKLVKNQAKTAFTIASIKSVFKKYANMDVSTEDARLLNKRSMGKKGKLDYDYKIGWEIGSMIANHYGVASMASSIRAKSKTGGHTGNMVPIFAYGSGAETFEGVMDNTDVFFKLKALSGY